MSNRLNINTAASEVEYVRLTQSKMKVTKCGRRGAPHEISVSLSQDRKELHWSSNVLGPKLGKTNRVELFRIKRIAPGQTTAQFNRAPTKIKALKDTSFSIFYSSTAGEELSLDVAVSDSEAFDYLLTTLQNLVTRTHQARADASPDELYLRDMWDRGDADHSNSLTTSEVVSLVASMNISMPTNTVKKMFKKFDADGSGALNFEEFTEFIALLRERKELKLLWKSVLDNSSAANAALAVGALPILDGKAEVEDEVAVKTITLPRMCEVWKAMQGEQLSEKDMIDRINNVSATKIPTEDNSNVRVSYQMFCSLFTHCGSNELFAPEREKIYQDMTQHSLSHYFIASSHNTYLEGDQLMSNSSVQRYIDDVTSGCRCVELDCWDGERGQPIIYHGHTLTSKILFIDVIRALREHAFKTTPYPLVLSIENHCCLQQQQRLATIMKEELGELLAWPTAANSRPGAMLPSPEQLRCKILVKGKRIGSPDVDDEEEEEDEKDGEEGLPNAPTSPSALPPVPPSSSSKDSSKKGGEKKHSTHPDLSEITYLGTGKVHGFDEQGNPQIPCDSMCSFSEGKTFKSLKSAETVTGWIKHNEKHLSRIYPKGTRVDSSNYDPVPAWTAGNQMVALNYQTPDIPMHCNRGRFRENGNCGYILKPQYMLTPTTPTGKGLKLVLTIISGHMLPKPGAATKGEVIDPFVHVSIHGTAEDEAEFKTKTINDNGFNPLWNEKKEFLIRNPELAVLDLEVMDEDVTTNEFIGFSALPVTCLRAGLRECNLYDGHGQRHRDYAFATLTVHVEMEQVYVV